MIAFAPSKILYDIMFIRLENSRIFTNFDLNLRLNRLDCFGLIDTIVSSIGNSPRNFFRITLISKIYMNIYGKVGGN